MKGASLSEDALFCVAWRCPGWPGAKTGPQPRFGRGRGPMKRRPAARCSPTLLGVVPSPRGPLTAVFGKGTGVETPPRPPVRKIGNRKRKDEGGRGRRRGRRGAPEGASRRKKDSSLRPRPFRAAAGRGAERASRTAYQNRSAETLAGLAHPACRPGRLPGAFSVLAHGDG